MNDFSKPSFLSYCKECKFAYASIEEHTAEDCLEAKKESANPCAKCSHGKYFHDDGFCVQAIAGQGGFLPKFCGRCQYEESII